ncbi:hypothetical protein LCGC14_1361660, partial [marine sediment metagenome]
VYNLRYIQVTIENMPTDPIITQIMLLKKHTLPRISEIGKSHQWPRWYTKTAMLSGPHTLRHSNFRRPIQAFRRHYPLWGTGEIISAEGIFEDCRGRLQPFIYQPGTAISEMFICQMTKDQAQFQEIQDQYKEVGFEFDQIYRITSGWTY